MRNRLAGRDVFWELLAEARSARGVLFVIAAVILGLTVTPPAQDGLVSLGQSTAPGPWLALTTGTVWLGISAWFWARLAMAADRMAVAGARYRMRRWLPAAAALILFLGVALALMLASRQIPRSPMMIENGAGRLMLAAFGLAGFGLVLAGGLATIAPRPPPLSRTAWLMVAGSVALAVAGTALFGAAPVRAAALVPPAAALMLAAAGLMAGSTGLVLLGMAWGLPILGIVLVGTAVLAVLRTADVIADNHDVRTVGGPLPARPTLREAFEAFVAASRARDGDAAPVRVVLVATSGGGLAAAFWTGTVLGDLADASPAFARQIFAISGVSGGSLGALQYVASRGGGCAGPRRRCLQQALDADFTGPALGSLLFPDLMQRFLPVVVFSDRAAAIEAAWETRWRAVFHDNRLASPFLSLWPKDHPWPVLLLNGTSANTGGRIVASNVILADKAVPALSMGINDLLAAENADIPASTAAGISARFPYITPFGIIRRHDDGRAGHAEDAVGDGGYFESYGATTLLDTLDALTRIARIDSVAVRFAVVQIISATGGRSDPAGPGWMPLGLAGPPDTLLAAREARGVNATEDLARRVTGLGGVYVPVTLGLSPTGSSAPLSWSLSDVARRVIDLQWTAPCRARLLAEVEAAPLPHDGTSNSMRPAEFMSMLHGSACAMAAAAPAD